MEDSFRGLVKNIIDDQTFEMIVKRKSIFKRNIYRAVEQIRISNLYARDIVESGKRLSKALLEQVLKNKEVRCYVHSRDDSGRLVAYVVVL